jgi:hypothetical protein
MRKFAYMLFSVVMVLGACASPAPTEAPANAPQVEEGATKTPRPTATRAATLTATPARLELEVVNSLVWADEFGQIRTSLMVHNPYDFPVELTATGANLINSAGEIVESDDLYFLDGVSGGTGFLLAGETVAADGCFSPCDGPPSALEWDSYSYTLVARESTNLWEFSTDVGATITSVDMTSDSNVFWVYGTVVNNSDILLERISVRVFVYDQAGSYIGAAEVSSWDVGAGASVSFSGYGIGQTPSGAVTYEVSALGVNY